MEHLNGPIIEVVVQIATAIFSLFSKGTPSC